MFPIFARMLYPSWFNWDFFTKGWAFFFSQELYSLGMLFSLVLVYQYVWAEWAGWAWLALQLGGVVVYRRVMAGGVCNSQRRLSGQTVVITGAAAGVGKETAGDLLRRGARVIMACRDVKRAEEVRLQLLGPGGGGAGGGRAEVRQLDLASFKSIREFAAGIIKSKIKIHILINNAGVMMCPYAETSDGFELQMGTNHLGHFLLTNLLLPQLMHGEPARIITLSSLVHLRGEINLDNLCHNKGNYDKDKGMAYNNSKLANVIFTRQLANKLKGTKVQVFAVHPGLVYTSLARHVLNSGVLAVMMPFFQKTPLEGAQTTIHCATDATQHRCMYFSDCLPGWPLDVTSDDVLAEKLWKLSEQLTSSSASS